MMALEFSHSLITYSFHRVFDKQGHIPHTLSDVGMKTFFHDAIIGSLGIRVNDLWAYRFAVHAMKNKF